MAAAAALIGVGMVLSAYGSITGGQAAEKAAREAARSREEAARYTRAVAAFDARRQRETDAETLGAYRVSAAKAGLAFSGSVATVYGEQVRRAEENALSIVLAGELRARGLEAEARLARLEGRSAQRAGYVNAVGYGVQALGAYSAATK